jgi:hypothetical protein
MRRMTGGNGTIMATSADEDRASAPGLLPPQAVPAPSSLVGAYLIAGGLALGAVFMIAGGVRSGDAPVPRVFVPADAGAAGALTLPSNAQNAPVVSP